MQWHEVDLNDLLATCRRELGFRERVYPRMIANGKLSEDKARKEIEGMRAVVEFLVHCVFKAVTRVSAHQQANSAATASSDAQKGESHDQA